MEPPPAVKPMGLGPGAEEGNPDAEVNFDQQRMMEDLERKGLRPLYLY